ncbi:MAG TPA: histidine kinase dimerization/phosphoacceptor domain -containing protein [Allosphingosinicella sp.]|nr:histidine kinase dimerization/phosphoacceptor domain -containing protein [Allosphingosinicella sp.]
MLFFLTLGLLVPGLIAVLASIDSARQNNLDRIEEVRARLSIKAQKIDETLSRSGVTIDIASGAVSRSAERSNVCEEALRRLERGPPRARYALYGEAGKLRCASAGLAAPAKFTNARAGKQSVEIAPGGASLRLYEYDQSGNLEGLAEFSRQTLSDLTYIPGTSRSFDLVLTQGERRMQLRDEYAPSALARPLTDTRPVARGKLELSIALARPPISLVELISIALPILMWIFAAATGWLIVDRLLLRPLVRMQRAVAAYKPGDRHLDIPRVATPAREIGDLGAAFDQVVQTVARHEANLEAAVERQTRLVREVHHRVKNNLQVVASLLNLHSRGSPNEEVAAAYASIQRRVDALAVVHRNHFAELEENKGVALKPLISELAANLRATAPASAAAMTIRLDLEPFHSTQDVAVSVAFLITELVEFAMFRHAESVAVSLLRGKSRETATLTVESEHLGDDGDTDETLSDRFERIVTGLSRQLRSTMERDPEAGRYAIDIAVVDRGER